MKNIFIRNKKILFIALPLFVVFYFMYLAVFQLNTLVSIGMKIFTHAEMKMEKVIIKEGSSLKEGRIEIINSKIYENKDLIADTPKIFIDYKDWKIERINIYNSKVKLVRNKSDINFVTIFTRKSDSGKEKTSAKKNKKPSSPILKKINVYNSKLNYVDISYSHEISQCVEDVNGYVNFEDGYKVDLKFTGEKGEEKYSYSFSNILKSYDMVIQLSNIKAVDSLVQYGFDSNGEITDVSGVMNLDLRINDDGFFGKGKLESGNLTYKDLAESVKNVNLDLDFLGEQIKIRGNYFIFDKEGKFKVDYDSKKGVDVNFDFDNIEFNELAKYKILEDAKIKIDDFNFDNININLSVKNNFKAQIDFKSGTGFKKEKVAFSNIYGQFVYENGIIKVNNFHADGRFDKEGKTVEREFNGNLYFRNKDGNIEINISYPEKQFLSNIDLKFLFNIDKDIFSFRLNSDIVDLLGRYNFKTNILSIEQNKNFKMLYDMKKNKVNHIDGYIDWSFDNYFLKTELGTDDGYKIKINSTLKKDDKIKGSASGFINLRVKNYYFNFKTEDLNIGSSSLKLFGGFEGYIKGQDNKIGGEILFDKLSVALPVQNIEVKNILGVLTLEKKDDISLIFQGEIDKVKYSDYEIGGFKASAKFSDNIIQIKNISNKFLTLSGNYSIINSNLELFVNGHDIDENTIKISDIKYNIESIDGKISGKVEELQGKLQIKNGTVNIRDVISVHFGGNINYLKNVISTENFLVNQNKIDFKYYLDKKSGEYNIKIFENSISDFVPGAKFRIIGISNGTLKDGKIYGGFRGSLNEFYYKETKIPNILFDVEYNNDEAVFKKIEFLSINDEKFAEASGIIDIKNKSINIDIPKQTVDINEIIRKEGATAQIEIDGGAEGTFDEYHFYLNGVNGKISYKNILLDKIGINLSGDKEKIVIEDFTSNYLGNELKINGEYDIPEKNYILNINSSEIDLSFLSMFLNDYGVDDISGSGKINLSLSNTVPVGSIILKNFKLSSEKYGIDLEKTNGNIELDKGYLRIKSFNGNLNEGTINIKGHLEASEVVNHLLNEDFEDIDYNLVLEGRNINYSYGEYFNLNFNTRLALRNKNIFGNVTINEGKIKNILKEDFGIVKIAKDFILNFIKRNKSERIIMENAKNSSLSKEFISDLKINVSFNIDKGIELDIAKMTNLFTNIKGKIFGYGKLVGNLGNLNFLGENDIQDGSFVLNGNKFIIDKGIIIFNDREAYIPELNPNIIFSTSSIINNKNFEISLDGPVKNLTFTIRSGNDVSVNSLDSILNGRGVENDGNNNVSILLTNIIGGQISDAILNPFVELLRNIGFSNLNVRSSIVAEEKKRDMEEQSNMTFGAYIEAESPIYKDKLFWKIKANFMNEAEGDSTSNENYNYGVADYDISVYSMLRQNTSLGIGMQKLRENIETKGRNMNYYIELKFEKKFDF